MSTAYPTFYRFTDGLHPDGLAITCESWHVIGETDQCYYLGNDYLASVQRGPKWPWVEAEIKRKRKRILKDGTFPSKRWAYADKVDALRAYKVRKKWQMKHAQLALERAKAAIGYFGDSTVTANTCPDTDRLIIPCDYIQQMNWADY